MTNGVSQLLCRLRSRRFSLFVGLLYFLSLGSVGAWAEESLATGTINTVNGPVQIEQPITSTSAPTSTVQNLYLPVVIGLVQPSAHECIPSAAGESNGLADALTICHAQVINGQVSKSDEWDVYKIAVEANRMLNAVLSGSGGDADLYLFPPGTISLDDTGAAWSSQVASNESISGTTQIGGDWYLAIRAYKGSIDYQLKVMLGEMVTPPSCVPDAAGDSNNIPDAHAICPSQAVIGEVSQDDVWDVYKINFADNTAIDITLTGTGEDANVSLYEPNVTDVLVNQPVAMSNNAGNEERIIGVIQDTPGTWFVAVRSYAGSTAYTLRVITPFIGAAPMRDRRSSEHR